MHFTFGLVDLAIFHLPSEMPGYLVQPRVLARTQNIDRGVVTIENDRVVIRAPVQDSNPSANLPKRTTISSEKFYEALSEAIPESVSALKAFTARLEPLGIEIDFGKESMILRGRTEANGAWNLAMITKRGRIWTDQIGSQANAVGLIDQAHTYLRELAAAVPGARVKETPSRTAWYVAMPDGYPTIDQLLPHADSWMAAMLAFLKRSTQALDRGNEIEGRIVGAAA
jgi:glycine/D-amino acid oxidase-like deaminating enzyme